MGTVLEEGPPTVHISTRHRPTYFELANQIEAIEKLGKWIAMSKMFGCDSLDQGCVIAADCFLTGMTLLEYQRRNKIVNGKPFKQYDAMLAEFHERGGKSKILKSTSEEASVEFSYDGKTQTVTLTWQELQKEPIPYLGKESEIITAIEEGKPLKLKPKYATPRSRQTMLIARLVSASIRVICPEVNYGTYTEEEFDYVDAESVVTVSPAKEESKRRIAESKVVETVAAPDPTTAEPEMPKLVADESHPATASLNAPALSAQIDEIKQLMAEIKNAGEHDIAEKVKGKLKASGLERLSDLSMAEASLLLTALGTKNVSLWISASLAGHKNPS